MSVFSRLNVFHSLTFCQTVFYRPVTNITVQQHSSCVKMLSLLPSKCITLQMSSRYLSTNKDTKQEIPHTLSQTEKLKQAVRDYGSTIVVFHVAISLFSLGLCYTAISNGVDAVSLLQRIGFSESFVSSKIAVGGSTFVVAYAVHKLFAPVRIGITLSAAPFIVRYLRSVNLIKPSKPKV